VETADIPVTQESSHVETTNEENVHQFLRHINGIVRFIPQG
jgi:hypothetical protein